MWMTTVVADRGYRRFQVLGTSQKNCAGQSMSWSRAPWQPQRSHIVLGLLTMTDAVWHTGGGGATSCIDTCAPALPSWKTDWQSMKCRARTVVMSSWRRMLWTRYELPRSAPTDGDGRRQRRCKNWITVAKATTVRYTQKPGRKHVSPSTNG